MTILLNSRERTKNYHTHLQNLTSQVENPLHGFFGPDSMAWKINREGVLGMGAMGALLMQLAHPKVAQGVAEHSAFRTRPFQRAYNTLHAQQVIVFGSCEQATAALTKVYARHNAVRGQMPSNIDHQAASSYHGNDPHLQMWVFATLIDSVMRSYNTFLSPLNSAQQEQFYTESKLFGQLMGIPESHLPPTLVDFQTWIDQLLASDEINVTPVAQDIAASLLKLPLPLFWPVNYILAAGALPPKLRAAYGLKWTPSMQRMYFSGVNLVRAVASRLPLRLRATPPYWRALKRCGAPTL